MAERDMGPLLACSSGFDTKLVLPIIREAMEIIHQEKPVLKVWPKMGYDGQMTDICTSADIKAQAAIVAALAEAFPGNGVICEECDDLAPGSLEAGVPHFIIDPVDGTKEYASGDYGHVSTMWAYVSEGKPIASCIGILASRDVYAYGPGIPTPRRYKADGAESPLCAKPSDRRGFDMSTAILRRPLDAFSEVTQKLVRQFDHGMVMRGSLGVSVARLCEGDARMMVLSRDSYDTSWDSIPMIGFCKALGFVFLKPAEDGLGFVEYDPILPTAPFRRGHDAVVIHKNDLSQVAKSARLTLLQRS